MRHSAHRRRAPALFRAFLYGGVDFHPLRYRSNFSVSVGAGLSEAECVWICRDVALHCHSAGWIHFPLEEGRVELGQLAARPESDSSWNHKKSPKIQPCKSSRLGTSRSSPK